MAICMAGIDHTKAKLDVRSVFSLTKRKMAEAYASFRDIPGIDGCVLLSTCNRMEIWLSGTEDVIGSPVDLLCTFLGVSLDLYETYFQVRAGASAVDHLFRLAAGLESMIIGEDQILTQVGDALVYSRTCAATDHALEVLFRLAVTGGKRVKTETVLSTADRSVIHTALQVLEQEEGFSVKGKTCMVIGNGMMGRLTAQTLLDRGADVTVTVRQYRSGIVDIPRECKRINYDDRMQLFPSCDFVVSATSSPNYTLRLEQMENLSVDHILPLIDLAVPRDIEPECGKLPWVRLYDIDSFHIDLETENLRENLKKAEGILEEEKKEFYDWYEGRDIVPRIQRMKEIIGKNVRGRMVPALRHAHLEKEEKQSMEESIAQASSRMMNRMLFGLKEKLTDQEFAHCLEAMEEMFR